MSLDDELRQIPLFLKAEEIFILVNKILTLINENSDNENGDNENNIYEERKKIVLIKHKNNLKQSAINILGSISNSYKENTYYHVRMQNAAFIRSDAISILVSIDYIEICGFKELDYLELIKKEVEEFRILFAEWVKTFNNQIYVVDTWGLFNPPGVNHDDFDINSLKNEGCYSPYDDFDFENINFDDFDFDDFDFEDDDEDDKDDDELFFDNLFNDKD